MIILKVGWEEELIQRCKNESGSNCGDPSLVAGVRRTVKARIKELTKMILAGQAEVVDHLPGETMKD